MIKATHEFDWFPRPHWGKNPRPFCGKPGVGKLCISFPFDVGYYIPPDLWAAWKTPPGWRKSGFYLRSNKHSDTDEFVLIFPVVRLYAEAGHHHTTDPNLIIATLKLMQQPFR